VALPTVKEILRDKVSLDIPSVDRVVLNGWVKDLPMRGASSPSSGIRADG
jgi:hypothetical protein